MGGNAGKVLVSPRNETLEKVKMVANVVRVSLHVLWNIGGFLTTVASIGKMGASIRPLIDLAIAIDPSLIVSTFVWQLLWLLFVFLGLPYTPSFPKYKSLRF
ncbi:hypothetical protein D0Y65_033467 [Glycine soja]|uniref:Uncharacterized protein n=1 Tax=Glycine soja TaxID=3848 RepID=A0A445HL89_GLYSO|nr:hypothetical protein D0Y65_033467 [Glycine soja]